MSVGMICSKAWPVKRQAPNTQLKIIIMLYFLEGVVTPKVNVFRVLNSKQIELLQYQQVKTVAKHVFL